MIEFTEKSLHYPDNFLVRSNRIKKMISIKKILLCKKIK